MWIFNYLYPSKSNKKMDTSTKKSIKVYGLTIDEHTRCEHYHSQVDIIAIKFKCCDKYYPCFQCHKACETHEIDRWKHMDFEEKAILCGNCYTELSIAEYMRIDECPNCHSVFNAGCRKHYHLYFEL